MNVYVVDTRDTVLSGTFLRHARQQPGPKSVIPVTQRWSMNQIVNRVKDHTQPGTLVRLCLCGHGNSGYMELGNAGLTEQSVRQFRILQNERRFDPTGRIEIHACAFASATEIGCQRRRTFELDHPTNPEYIIYASRCVEATPGTANPGAPGLPILQRMANDAGIKVIAAINAQSPDAHFRFEGDIVVRHPQ